MRRMWEIAKGSKGHLTFAESDEREPKVVFRKRCEFRTNLELLANLLVQKYDEEHLSRVICSEGTARRIMKYAEACGLCEAAMIASIMEDSRISFDYEETVYFPTDGFYGWLRCLEFIRLNGISLIMEDRVSTSLLLKEREPTIRFLEKKIDYDEFKKRITLIECESIETRPRFTEGRL